MGPEEGTEQSLEPPQLEGRSEAGFTRVWSGRGLAVWG